MATATDRKTKVLELKNLIGGEFSDPSGGEMEDVLNPATGEVIARAPLSSKEDVDKAVAAARKAFETWGRTTPAERQVLMLKMADAFEERADEITDLETMDAGKPRQAMFDEEIGPMVDQLRFFAGAARTMEGKAAGEYMEDHTSYIRREPVGVCAQITPWNYPLMMAVWKIGPALATGNTLVLKPAETTPVTTLKVLAEICAEILPPGVANFIGGHGDPAGSSLVTHPDVDFVSLTGSPETGKWIAQAAADSLKRVHLELGGKAPALVFADANLAEMARGVAMGATYNTGQDCTAATRVYISRDVYGEAVEALRATLEQITVGDPWDPATDIGPLISAAHRARVHGSVERSVAAGASVLCGGSPLDGPGFYYPPTLVADARQESEIVQSELFGPILVALPFDGEDEAVRLANDTPYGLASSVWSTDVARALRVSHRLDVGVTWVNDHLPIASEAPHGGVKGSGFGKDMSQEAVQEYSVTRHLMIKHQAPEARESFRPA